MREPYAFDCRNCKRVSELPEHGEARCPVCGSGAGFYAPKSVVESARSYSPKREEKPKQ